MGCRQFKMGERHGLAGTPWLAHRNGRRYDGQSAQASYGHGYEKGAKQRMTRARYQFDTAANAQAFLTWVENEFGDQGIEVVAGDDRAVQGPRGVDQEAFDRIVGRWQEHIKGSQEAEGKMVSWMTEHLPECLEGEAVNLNRLVQGAVLALPNETRILGDTITVDIANRIRGDRPVVPVHNFYCKR